MPTSSFIARRVAGAAFALALAAARPAQAQPTPTPPYRPVFGAAEASPSSGSRLDVMFDVVEAYDDDVYADLVGVTPSSPQDGGFYTSFTPHFDFQSTGRRVKTALTASTNGRYYQDEGSYHTTSNAIGAGLTAQIGRRGTLSLNQGVSYSPAYLFGLFAETSAPTIGDAVPPATDYYTGAPASMAYATTAGFARELTTRTALTINGNYNFTNFEQQVLDYDDLNTYNAGGTITHSISRSSKYRVGYVYSNAEYSETFTPSEHRPEFGMDFTRPLSPSRNASVSFTVNPLILRGAVLGDTAETKFTWGGSFNVHHEMTRTWVIGAALSRGASFVEGFAEPLITNGGTATLTGFLNRRTDLSFQASGSAGESTGGGPFRQATATSSLRVALNRIAAVTVSYLFYYYDFDQSFALPPGASPMLTRNGVRIGLTLWAPVRH